MNWEAIGAVGQVLGSIAVFVTLGYLAVQVKHARLEARSTARQARSGSTRETMLVIANNPDLPASIAALNSAMGWTPPPFTRFAIDHGLTPAQAGQVNAWMRVLWEGVETSIATAGQQDADELAALDQRVRGGFAQGVLAKWYELNRQTLNPSTVRYIDNLLAQPG